MTQEAVKDKLIKVPLKSNLLSPQAIVLGNPVRSKGESLQSYATRLLKIAMREWVKGIFDDAEHIVAKEAEGKKGQAADACSNIMIDMHQSKVMQLELLGLNS